MTTESTIEKCKALKLKAVEQHLEQTIALAEQSFVRLAMSHTGIKAMAAAILGGMESIRGAIIGGLIIGVVEGFAANYLSGAEIGGFHFGDIKDVAAFAMMIVILMVRPRGIFGTEKVERV